MTVRWISVLCFLWAPLSSGWAGQFSFGDLNLTVPDGFVVEKVAGPPLVDRPIMADLDERGRLYVADSSGSNAKVETQLEEKPHRIVRLEDTDGDGRYDSRVVFADRMMFPEGVLWHRGALYVSAPPVIWKLTDLDGDGRCDRREVWHDGKTLTGCANDLHGPYLGWDGWIYWCKGAFAEQTYAKVDGSDFVSRAAHIFRKHPDGGLVEPVMTGGMDNPVEVVFSPEGERFFTTTFLQHPGGGRRDGIIHAIYGGVYGKDHSVLEGHPRTGDLMPVMTQHGPAASCALMRYESSLLGAAYQGNLFASLFNMRKITRHELVADGATYRTIDHDFLVGDHIDFHPTDVLEDADGSLLVVDTGGWYKLCCPTSQLPKPEVLGAIYRVRKEGVRGVADPPGKAIEWTEVSLAQLVERLDDGRVAVWKRAIDTLAQRKEAYRASGNLKAKPPRVRQRFLWAMTRLGSEEARAWVRQRLADPDAGVRHAALHAVSVWRDEAAASMVASLLRDSELRVQRAAAEALGRIGNGDHLVALLEALERMENSESHRVVEHSLRYALIEIGDEQALLSMLERGDGARHQAASLTALRELKSPLLTFEILHRFLHHPDKALQRVAWSIVAQHPQWSSQVLKTLPAVTQLTPEARSAVAQLAGEPAMEAFLAECLSRPEARDGALEILEEAALSELPSSWGAVLANLLSKDRERLPNVLRILRQARKSLPRVLAPPLIQLGVDSEMPSGQRLDVLELLMDSEEFPVAQVLGFLIDQLKPGQVLRERRQALEIVSNVRLTASQRLELAGALGDVGPMELSPLTEYFLRVLEGPAKDAPLATGVFQALAKNASVAVLSPGTIQKILETMPPELEVSRKAIESAAVLAVQSGSQQKERLEALLESLPGGDVIRGQTVFNSAETAHWR